MKGGSNYWNNDAVTSPGATNRKGEHKMRNSLCKMQYVLFVLLMFGLSACGTTGSNTTADNGNAGSITAKVVMAKSSAKTVALQADVTKIRLIVTGPTIPTAKKDFANNTGGTVEVYPGSDLTLTAQGFDASGAMIYEGFATGLTVVAGPTPTDAGTITMLQPVAKATDSSCLSCHASTRDIAGQNLVVSYKQSGHYTNDTEMSAKNGSTQPGCAGCHGTQHNDVSPSASGRCFECHGANLSLKHTSATALVAGDANAARYITIGGKNCSACHEPHNPIKGAGKQERKDWEKSGHGDINGAAWVHYDFTTRNNCTACHTSAGFVKVLDNNFTDNSALSATTLGKQPLTCDACHSSNDFKKSVRTLSTAFVAPYTPSLSASAAFPAGTVIGNSQLCIPCHAGLASGQSVTNLPDANMGNVSFINSHYMAAAGIMYVKAGYTDFIDPATVIGASTYGKSLTSTDDGGAISSTHRKLGTAPMATDSHVGGQSMISGGPCVVCHMPKAGHTWEINGAAFDEICVKCHTAEGAITLTAANFKAVFIEEQSAVFQDALNLALATLSSKYNITYNQAAYPYFYDNSLSPVGAVKDWTRGGTLSAAEAKKLMGACFNINILKREPAAYAHARTYSRRLIYDTIDFLDNKTIDMSVGTTAVAYNPVMYVKGATAMDVATTEAFKFLAGYNRTSGVWNALERP